MMNQYIHLKNLQLLLKNLREILSNATNIFSFCSLQIKQEFSKTRKNVVLFYTSKNAFYLLNITSLHNFAFYCVKIS